MSVKDDNVLYHEGTSRTLLEFAREGDQEAWRKIAAIYQPLVSYWARKLGTPEADVPDVAQDVFFAAFRKLQEFERERTGSFRNWLKSIAQSKVADVRRKNRLPMAETLPDDLPDIPETDLELSEERRLFFQRVVDFIRANVKEPTWQKFSMHCMEAIPIAEVAVQLGVTRGSVDIALCRVKSLVRSHFGEVIDERWLR